MREINKLKAFKLLTGKRHLPKFYSYLVRKYNLGVLYTPQQPMSKKRYASLEG